MHLCICGRDGKLNDQGLPLQGGANTRGRKVRPLLGHGSPRLICISIGSYCLSMFACSPLKRSEAGDLRETLKKEDKVVGMISSEDSRRLHQSSPRAIYQDLASLCRSVPYADDSCVDQIRHARLRLKCRLSVVCSTKNPMSWGNTGTRSDLAARPCYELRPRATACVIQIQ